MDDITFEWNESKNTVNIRKHKVSFDEAKTVFYDEDAILFSDENLSNDEERYIMLGVSESARLLVVCHCYMERRNAIRIYSARKATRNEGKFYYER
jgi:hypothetical protein